MEPYLEKLLAKNQTKKVQNKNIDDEINEVSYLKNHFPEYKNLNNPDEYKIIKEAVWEMWKSGIITRGSGFCLSMSDMARKILSIKGVPCEIVECDLTIFNSNSPSMSLIGHDKLTQVDYETIDSHVVCIAGSKDKFILDLSISHFKDLAEKFFICQKIENTEDASLCSFNLDGVIWNYNLKQNSKLPELHQQSILKRIETDRKIFENIKKLNIFIIVIFTLTGLNFIRGIYDFNQKYIIKDNNFGPSKTLK